MVANPNTDDATNEARTAGPGHNSDVDPGPAKDFKDEGPLATWSDIKPEARRAFYKAIRSQGSKDVRQAAITNACARARANPEIPHLAYRVMEQIAARCRWKHRYHCESNEMAAYFVGLDVANNLPRNLQLLCQLGVLAGIAVPRKAGGRPLMFYTVVCLPEDRLRQSVSILYKAWRAKEVANHHHDGLSQQAVAMLDCEESQASEERAPNHHHNGLNRKDVPQTITMMVSKPSPRWDANHHHDGHTVDKITVEREEEENKKEGAALDVDATLNDAHHLNGNGAASVALPLGNGRAPTEPTASSKGALVPRRGGEAGLPTTLAAQPNVPIELFEQYHQGRTQSKPGAITFPDVGMTREMSDVSLTSTLEAYAQAGHEPAQIVLALTQTLSECTTMQFSKARSFVSYFNQTMDTKLEKKAVTRIKVTKEQRIADTGVAAYAAACDRKKKLDFSVGVMIGRQTIKQSDLDRVVREIPGATDEQARDAFIAVGRRKGDPSKAAVIDAAILHLGKQVLHKRHGDPAKQAGGEPATIDGQRLESDWVTITQDKLDAWQVEFPTNVAGSAARLFKEAVDEIDKPHERYGTTLQDEFETAFRAKLAAAHAKHEAEAERQRRQHEAERLAKERQERNKLLWDEAGEIARRKSGKSAGDWVARTDNRRELTQAEYDLLLEEEKRAAP